MRNWLVCLRILSPWCFLLIGVSAIIKADLSGKIAGAVLNAPVVAAGPSVRDGLAQTRSEKITALQKDLLTDPDNPTLRLALVNALIDNRQWQQAGRMLPAVSKGNQGPGWTLKVARTEMRLGQYHEALARLKPIIQSKQSDDRYVSQAVILAGEALLRLKRYIQAREMALEKAGRFEADLIRLRANYYLGDEGRARPLLNILTDARPDDPRILQLSVREALDRNAVNEAAARIGMLARVEEEGKGSAGTVSALARIELDIREGRLQDAARGLSRLQSITENSAVLMQLHALLAASKGDMVEAARIFQSVSHWSGGMPRARLMRAAAEYFAGHPGQAQGLIDDALLDNPGDSLAIELAGEFGFETPKALSTETGMSVRLAFFKLRSLVSQQKFSDARQLAGALGLWSLEGWDEPPALVRLFGFHIAPAKDRIVIDKTEREIHRAFSDWYHGDLFRARASLNYEIRNFEGDEQWRTFLTYCVAELSLVLLDGTGGRDRLQNISLTENMINDPWIRRLHKVAEDLDDNNSSEVQGLRDLEIKISKGMDNASSKLSDVKARVAALRSEMEKNPALSTMQRKAQLIGFAREIEPMILQSPEMINFASTLLEDADATQRAHRLWKKFVRTRHNEWGGYRDWIAFAKRTGMEAEVSGALTAIASQFYSSDDPDESLSQRAPYFAKMANELLVLGKLSPQTQNLMVLRADSDPAFAVVLADIFIEMKDPKSAMLVLSTVPRHPNQIDTIHAARKAAALYQRLDQADQAISLLMTHLSWFDTQERPGPAWQVRLRARRAIVGQLAELLSGHGKDTPFSKPVDGLSPLAADLGKLLRADFGFSILEDLQSPVQKHDPGGPAARYGAFLIDHGYCLQAGRLARFSGESKRCTRDPLLKAGHSGAQTSRSTFAKNINHLLGGGPDATNSRTLGLRLSKVPKD